MPDTTPVRFHFDFISPYAYLAWTQIHALCARHGRAVEPVPTLFAALLDAHGQKGPAEIPAKRAYVFKDALRTATALGIPIGAPPSHPFNPLVALRVCTLDRDPGPQRLLIDALYAATWGGGAGVESREEVARILHSLGHDPDATIAAAETPANKERLRTRTAEAVAAGVFGVPTAIADGEIAWPQLRSTARGGTVRSPGTRLRGGRRGVDSLPHLDRALAGHDPFTALPAETRARWQRITPTATRKGSAGSTAV
jgi:2-hydroxychromene-2-carboxylate isomerase